MVSRLLRALKGLFTTPREHYDPSGDPFLELDLAEVRRKLRPGELGGENGRRERPPTGAISPDQDERQFHAFFANELERCVKECELRLGGYAERLKGLRLATAPADIGGLAESTRQDLEAIADQSSNELFAERTRVSGLQKDLVGFRREHGLDREPVERKPSIYVYGVLLLLLVVEVPLNGLMLARGDERGLVGGGAQALVLAALNLLVAYVAGSFVLPHVHHRSRLRRVAAWASAVAVALIAIGFNLMVAHYRDALGLQAADPARAALDTLRASPLILGDVQSYLLFTMGLAFAAIATVDGYKRDDPYPGYGRIAAIAARAQEEFAAARRACFDDLAERRDAGLEQLKQIAMAAELAQQQNGILRARQQQTSQRYRAHREYLCRSLMSIATEYRTANRAARQSPAPAYYDTEMTLPELPLTEFAASNLREDELRRAVREGSSRIVEAFDTASRRLPTVEQLSTSDIAYVQEPDPVGAA